MLGKPSRRARKKLEAEGRTAPAIVLEIADRGTAGCRSPTATTRSWPTRRSCSRRACASSRPGAPTFEVDGVLNAMSARTGLDMSGLMSTIREAKAEHPGDRHAMAEALRAQLGQTGSVVFATPAADPISQLERLAALHASGTLTDAEFAEQNARVLGES